MVATIQESRDNAYLKGEAYTFPVTLIDPTGDEDYFWHIINNGKEPIDIDGVSFQTTVVGLMSIDRVTGTAAGGQTPVTQVNRRTGLDVLVENVICSTDPDITGLTEAGRSEVVPMGVAQEQYRQDFPIPIRLNQGQQLAGLWGEATGILSGVIHWHKVTEPQEN